MSDQRSWCWWSTHETIQNEVPSVTAILETIIAVPLFWWIARRVGVIAPLLISAAVAPLVLLRSDASVALGLKLIDQLDNRLNQLRNKLEEWDPPFEHLLRVSAIVVALPPITLVIRVTATLFYLSSCIKGLPRNFRRLVFCTSPAQIPELVPDIEETHSRLRFSLLLYNIFDFLDFGYGEQRGVRARLIMIAALLGIFLPVWLYRITIKSTAWFWWPLAFLGGDLKRVQNPALFHWQALGSLWAKTSIALAVLSLTAFVAVNFVSDSAVFERNPLLTPVGYFLLMDWNLQIWQVCALLAAVLSIVIVYLVNDVSGQYRIAQDTGDATLLEAATNKYGWIERLTRLRLLVLLAFWGLVGTHAVLYANSTKCWFSLPPALQGWAKDIYGDRLPRSDKCPQ